jgi:AcrR family transcriptional regulator
MGRRTRTRERLIETAAGLFWAQGYAQTGVSAIIKRAGATSGSFYHFFATKEDLLLAVIDRVGAVLDAEVLGPAEAEAQPRDRVRAMAARYRECLSEDSTVFGLPVGHLVGELGTEHPEARGRVAGLFESWVGRVEGWLGEMAELELGEAGRRELAELVVSALEGAAVQARVRGELRALDACIAHVARTLDASRAGAAQALEPVRRTPAGGAGGVDWRAW